MNWKNTFDEIYGANKILSQETIHAFLKNWNIPLTEDELRYLKNNDQKPSFWNDERYGIWKPKEFENWTFPQNDFPESFIELITEYSGCGFLKGDREFSIFGPNELRQMNIDYELPQYLNGAVSIGLDGAGNHIIFDMRLNNPNNEYKIYGVHSGNLDWDGAKLIANTFIQFVNETKNIDEIVNG